MKSVRYDTDFIRVMQADNVVNAKKLRRPTFTVRKYFFTTVELKDHRPMLYSLLFYGLFVYRVERRKKLKLDAEQKLYARWRLTDM